MTTPDTTIPSGLVIVSPESRVVEGAEQTTGMCRETGVSPITTGSVNLWSGHVTTPGGTRSGAHHHGDVESAIFVIDGRARFRWGPGLSEERIVGPGDFVYVPAGAVHAEENLSDTDPVVFIVSRNSGTMLTVNLDPDDPACASGVA